MPFQRSVNKEEASGYASSCTVSSEQTRVMSVNMVDDNLDEDLHRRMEAQEQNSTTQQEALKNIQQILAQLLANWTSTTLITITMRRSITMMNILRLRSQRKAPQLIPR